MSRRSTLSQRDHSSLVIQEFPEDLVEERLRASPSTWVDWIKVTSPVCLVGLRRVITPVSWQVHLRQGRRGKLLVHAVIVCHNGGEVSIRFHDKVTRLCI